MAGLILKKTDWAKLALQQSLGYLFNKLIL
jgi:hypothetical protein